MLLRASLLVLSFLPCIAQAQSGGSGAPQTISEQVTLPSGAGVQVYHQVDEPARFSQPLMAYLSAEVRMPPGVGAADVAGKCIVRFIVTDIGEVVSPQILRTSGNAALDEELLRVLRAMPPWIPARAGGASVASYFKVPVLLELK